MQDRRGRFTGSDAEDVRLSSGRRRLAFFFFFFFWDGAGATGELAMR